MSAARPFHPLLPRGAWRRWFPPLALAVIAVLTVWLYIAKAETLAARDRVAALRGEVEGLRADVQALEAEAAMLESPARVEALAGAQLALDIGAAAQARPLADLPAVLPPPQPAQTP